MNTAMIFSALDHDEYLVAEALLIKKELKLTEVQQVLRFLSCLPGYQSSYSKESLFCVGSIEANLFS
jgi:hypothetical protein